MTTTGPAPEDPAPHITLQGELICANDSEVSIVRAALPHHIDLTRAEPECLAFEVVPSSDPKIWQVSERFTSPAGFRAHQRRIASSDWGRLTAGVTRRYIIKELYEGQHPEQATIPTRLATRNDAPTIAAMLHEFNQEFEEPSPGTAFLTSRLTTLISHPECFAIIPTYQPVAFGIVTLRPNIWADGKIATLDELYTKPHYRSLGFGAAILDAAITHARQQHATDFTIEVDQADIEAHRFYTKHGFPLHDPTTGEAAYLLWKDIMPG